MGFFRRTAPKPSTAARAALLHYQRLMEVFPEVGEGEEREFWELQRQCFMGMAAGDDSLALPCFLTSYANVSIRADKGQWIPATASALIFVSAMISIDAQCTLREQPFPEDLAPKVQRMHEWTVHIAHLSGVPLASAILAEELSARKFSDRMTARALSEVFRGSRPLRDLARIKRDVESRKPTAAQLRANAEPDHPGQSLKEQVTSRYLKQLEQLSDDPARSYLLSASSVGQAAYGALSTGRTVLYIAPGFRAGAAIRLNSPGTGLELCESVELPLLSGTAVRAQVRELREVVGATDEVKPRLTAIGKALADTAERVWQPVLARWPDLYGMKVALIPLGASALLPLYTAPVDEGPACARMDLTVVPSGKALMLAGSWPAPGPASTLVACDPSSGEATIRMTLREARAVADVHGVEPLFMRPPPGAETPSGPEPDELLRRISQAGLVHLACHGELHDAAPLESKLQLGQWIALSTLLEHDLRPGSTVVLSACHLGGIGDVLTGEQLGFPAALLAMGARSVIAPLWSIPDTDTTVALITDLHRELRTHSPSVALGRTIAEAAKRGVRPTVWAAFTHFGA
ncbi:CHAT domain-containing protein [Streptomyces hokutonensis]|uniref:CHAT domain-containing protein n=1 Tax=Streptomyces hokutonensis TaxID=1306990 RepID=A0ABW6LW77_9ACTN